MKLKKLAFILALALTTKSWAILSEGKTGLVNSSNGAVNGIRTDKTGATVNTEGHARYQEAVLNGNVYIGADLGGTPVTTVAGLSGALPALTLYNPVGSGVNLVLVSATVDITSSPGAATGIELGYNVAGSTAPASTTLANVTPALLGSGKLPIGQCYRVATLANSPLAMRFMGGTTGTSAIGAVQLIDHVDGEVIILPGNAVSIQTTAATALLASFTWEEVPQ